MSRPNIAGLRGTTEQQLLEALKRGLVRARGPGGTVYPPAVWVEAKIADLYHEGLEFSREDLVRVWPGTADELKRFEREQH